MMRAHSTPPGLSEWQGTIPFDKIILHPKHLWSRDLEVILPSAIVALSVLGSLFYNIVLGDDVLHSVLTMFLGIATMTFAFTLLVAVKSYEEAVEIVERNRKWILDRW